MVKLRVAILGATGAIGQQFVRFCNPTHEIVCLTASQRSAGKNYSEVVRWYADFGAKGVPDSVKNITLTNTTVEDVKECGDVDVVFSALPSEIAREIEPQFAKEGKMVVSKGSVFRMEPDVPLLIPEVNPDHLQLLEIQRKNRNWTGGIVADPNCTTTGLVLTLKPILDSFGIKKILVSTMQATSGAGYRGLSPVVITDNLLPYISGEEEKTETETLKIFGRFDGNGIKLADLKVSASCNRVNVDYGHMEDVFLETEKPCEPEEVTEILKNFTGLPQELKLPSAPEHPIVVRDEIDRPQPKLDVNEGKGMSVVVGRIRENPIFENGIKYTLLVHNAVRGGAGMAVLNAELLDTKGLIK